MTLYLVIISYNMFLSLSLSLGKIALIVDYLILLFSHLKIVGIWIYIRTLSIVFFLDHCIIELQAKLFLYLFLLLGVI